MKPSVIHKFRLWTFGLLLVAACSSCASVNKWLPWLPWETAYFVHRVKWEGEALSILAKWYTGNIENWKAIAKANPALDPNRIVIGTDIRIPADLLITRRPMPKSFVTGFNAGKKAKPTAPEAGTRPEPPGVPAPAGTQPQGETDKSTAPTDKRSVPEVSEPATPAAVIPAAEPEKPSLPNADDPKPVLPEKERLPLTTPAQPPEKNPAAASSAPGGSDQKPMHPKPAEPREKDEPPLFGPKGYSN